MPMYATILNLRTAVLAAGLILLATAAPAAPGAQSSVRFIKDCADCPEMAVIPAGSFQMGDLAGNGRSHEKPVHTVTFSRPFAIGRHEVTFAEWDSCVAAGGCKYKPSDEGWGRGKRPATDVSADDANEYARWLSRKTGHAYRLPTEAEWEYAARAGTTTLYSWGDATDRGKATYGKNAEAENPTSLVGSFPPNGFGLYDMHGNLREWVADCWHSSYSGAPADGSAWTQECDEDRNVIRGGAWNYGEERLRAAARDRHSPGNHHTNLGFRIARTVESP